jgi:hypothetical protein
LADIDTVRLLIADRVKKTVNENVGEGDASNLRFQFDMFPLTDPPTAHVAIFLTGATAATNTYVISAAVGGLTFNAGNAPAAGHTVLACYDYVALTTAETNDLLSGHTGSPYLIAARACALLAADTSRLFAYTMGNKKVDKTQVARNLLRTSERYEKLHYAGVKDARFGAEVVTFKDDTGTPYEGYDTAVAFLTGTG